MDNNLERSLRFLEDALTTPSKGLFKVSNTNRNRYADLSITLAPGEIEELNRDSSSLDTSMYNNTMATLGYDKSLAGSVIHQGNPWKSTVNNLYMEFAEILQNTSGGADILGSASDLARCCSDALAVVQQLKSTVTVQQIDEEKWLENERNNWRLLYVLYQDRIQTQNAMTNETSPYLGKSEKLCVDNLFKSDSLIRESQLVIDWLERNALEKDDPILHHSDWTYGWEHTLHQLLSPETIAFGSNIDIIKNIHPDAPQFENLSLHHLDDTNEKQFCQRIFTEIRCGNLEKAQELCYNCGHPWRAAMLEGWKLFHNPNAKEILDEENNTTMEIDRNENIYRDVEGNASRDLWKSTAIQYCKKRNLNTYEKAAVAAFCGNLDSILPVCNTWEDYLWAYMRAMVDIRVESEIRDTIIKTYVPLPEEYWEQKMSLDEIFSVLESSKSRTVRNESQEIDHIIQKHIILDDISKLEVLLEEWASDENISAHSLRFFAHLVIFFDNIGECYNHKCCEKVIEEYINRLSEMNETQLVAFYVSKLNKRKQVFIYANHLEKILDNESRKLALEYAEQFDLNVFEITQTVVENIRSRPSELEDNGTLNQKLTEADQLKISALDWLVFYEEQRLEALKQTNALIFKFLTLGKLDSAQLAINKIPQESVKKIKEEVDQLDNYLNQIIKEYFSYRAYLEAHEAFNEWFKQYKNKPLPPPQLPETAQFTEKVAYQHRVSQYNAELERWKLITSQSSKLAKTLLYNVLLFPNGWLAGGEDTEYLRSVCIPEIVLLLYSVLSESGSYEEAVQLADLIASEKYLLYKVYSKEKLGEVLEKICESSVNLLKAKKDPWGNSTTA